MSAEQLNGLSQMLVNRPTPIDVNMVIQTFALKNKRKMRLASVLDDPKDV